MENHRCEEIHNVLLSMNISCCELCPMKLKKKLLRMPGVDSVSMDVTENLIRVTGTVDPLTLLKKVEKLGKRVELVPPDSHHSPKQRATRYRDNKCGVSKKKSVEEKKEEEPHKCEAYEPPKVDERVCRDFYCKTHPRSRSIVDKASGSLPFFCGFGPYSNSPYMCYGDGFGFHQPGPQFGHPCLMRPPFYYQ
ncbi:hypothetical protein CASFOL_025838 [Castilleja foliolosa]|uniref:HMA domain-containing protein n=1 Tax=Castilleja foliolosa TaxID=1961234 RepID=A0ABD3CUS3_9LAMI